MFDYTIEVIPMCATMDGPITRSVGKYTVTGLFHERSYPECTCPAYKFGKRTVNFGGRMMPPPCKHIKEAEKDVCGWHGQYSEENYRDDDKCPRCGGPVKFVRCAV